MRVYKFMELWSICFLILLTQGCSSAVSRSLRKPSVGFPAYCGVRTNMAGWHEYASAKNRQDLIPFLPGILLIDLPFSFAADTVMLPADMIAGIVGNRSPNCGQLKIGF